MSADAEYSYEIFRNLKIIQTRRCPEGVCTLLGIIHGRLDFRKTEPRTTFGKLIKKPILGLPFFSVRKQVSKIGFWVERQRNWLNCDRISFGNGRRNGNYLFILISQNNFVISK